MIDIKRDFISHYTLEIELIFNNTVVEEDRKSGDIIEPRNVLPENQLTDEQLSSYNDFIRTVASAIEKRDFKIVEEYQSSNSYSYYIQFTPEFYEGMRPEIVLDVKFRLSDHIGHGTEQRPKNPNTNIPIFKSFVINGIEHNSIVDTLQRIISICNELQMGNYNIP